MSETVYIPQPESSFARTVRRGSGIVGKRSGTAVLVCYEGDLYDATNIATWADRLYHAWDRLVSNAPTSAKALVPFYELIPVANFDGQTIVLWPDHDRDLLSWWLGTDDIESQLHLADDKKS